MFTCGIDIGGTKVMIGFVDQDKNIVFSRKYYEPKGITQQDFTAWLTETFRQACTEAGISTEQIEFCGMGVPGTVSQDGRVAVKIPNLGWENYPVAAEFEAETGIAAALVQDSRAGAWGEYMAGVWPWPWRVLLRGFAAGMHVDAYGLLALGIKLLVDLRIDERLSDTGRRRG